MPDGARWLVMAAYLLHLRGPAWHEVVSMTGCQQRDLSEQIHVSKSTYMHEAPHAACGLHLLCQAGFPLVNCTVRWKYKLGKRG